MGKVSRVFLVFWLLALSECFVEFYSVDVKSYCIACDEEEEEGEEHECRLSLYAIQPQLRPLF